MNIAPDPKSSTEVHQEAIIYSKEDEITTSMISQQ